jgi:NDP-sugar pyrophosphorylase family protein
MRSDVHGIVLAGVHAWGESVLERVVCRPLVPIAGRPLIAHALSWLRRGGVGSASICANSDTVHLRRQLQDGSKCGIALDYYEDVMPRGPAGCARDVAAEAGADLYLVVEGTILPRVDLPDLLERHVATGAALTIVVTEIGPEHERMYEPAGIYVFSRTAFQGVSPNGYQDIKEKLIPDLHKAGVRVETYVVGLDAVASVSGIGSYLAVTGRALETLLRDSTLYQEYAALGEARIHPKARVHSTARIVGPVLLEKHCLVSAGALIVGPVTIGQGSVIGQRAVVSRSVLWSQCTVGPDAVLDHSVLTDGACVEAGVTSRHEVLVSARHAPLAAVERLLGRRLREVPATKLLPWDLPAAAHKDAARHRLRLAPVRRTSSPAADQA